MKLSVASSLTGVCLAALTIPLQAYAQDQVPVTSPVTPVPGSDPSVAQPAPQSGEGNEIIVTARRRDERLQDVPAVVNAVTADQIARLNFRNFTEVQNVVPGLQLAPLANGTGANAQLRGVNFDINASGNNPTVEFYFNDAPITAGVILQQLYDVGQIEVLRGPQGTLRGRASPSGSITVTAHRPDLNSYGGYVDMTANDIGTMNINAALNIPIVPGMLAVRVAGVENMDNNNNVRTIASAPLDARDPYSETQSYRGSAVFTPFDFLRFEGTYQHLSTFRRGFDQVESANISNPNAAAAPVLITARDMASDGTRPRYVGQVYDIYNGRAELALFGQQLVYQFQNYRQDVYSPENQDRAQVFPTANVYQVTRSHPRSESHEVRLQNQTRLFSFLDYVVGYFDNFNKAPTTLNSPTVVRLPAAFGGGIATIVQTPIIRTGQTHEASYYGNLTAHIGDRINVSGGVRFIHLRDVSQLFVNGALLTNDRQDLRHTIYTASAQYFLTPDIQVYASTGSSFRPGVSAIGDFNIARSTLENSFLQLPPETSTSYEAGLKSTLFDRRVRFNISGYHQNFQNYPYRSPGGVYYVNTVAVRNAAGQVTGTAQQVGIFNFVAAVPVEVNGVEGDLSFDVNQRFNLGLTASYSIGRIKNGTIPCTDLNGDGIPDSLSAAPTLAQLQARVGANNISACRANQRSGFLPPFSATVQGEYHQPITGAVDGYIRGLLNFQGQSQTDPTNLYDDVRSYALFNLYAGLRGHDGNWEINFFAKNLFNDYRTLSQTPRTTSYQQLSPAFVASGVTATSPYVGITTTPQREFGLNLRYRFGSR